MQLKIAPGANRRAVPLGKAPDKSLVLEFVEAEALDPAKVYGKTDRSNAT